MIMTNVKKEIYSREELLKIGRNVLKLKQPKRVSPDAWREINNLGLATVKRTHRGKRAGRSKSYKQKPLNNIRVALLNTHSVCNKASELNTLITDDDIDLIFITETWLTGGAGDNVVIAELLPNGYNIFHTPRENSRGGGLAVIFKESIIVKCVQSKVFQSFENMIVRVVAGSLTFLFVLIYRPPPSQKNKQTFNDFIGDFSTLLEESLAKNGKLIILGDFNIHAENENDPCGKVFLQLLKTSNLQQHVKYPTHIHGHTLDLIITRLTDETVCDVNVKDANLSDHKLITLHLPTQRPPLPKREINYRDYKSIDRTEFRKNIESSPLHRISVGDPVELVKLYNDTLSNILEKHAPLKHKTVILRPLAPWYNEEIHKHKMYVRKCEKTWRKSKLAVHREMYCSARTALTKLIKKGKRRYIQTKVTNAEQSQKSLFQCMDLLIYKAKNTSLPSNIPPDQLPNRFRDFFASKIETIQDGFNENDKPNDMLSQVKCQLPAFNLISSDDMRKIIRESPTKSCSLDPLPTFLLKECLDELTPVITTIVNSSLSTGIVPKDLKKAIITPLLKKPTADCDVLSNYRPVSNLAYISKLLEKVVSIQLATYKHQNNLNEKFQSAYRLGHSTETALLRVQNDILSSIDCGQCVFLVLLDLSAAFDTVVHEFLIARLYSRFGIKDNAIKWIKSYLTERVQSVHTGGISSMPTPLKWGVPQGSVLGPSFFSDYIAPLAAIIQSSGVCMHGYADDTQLYLSFTPGLNEAAQLQKLEDCIEGVRVWMRKNKLKLNDGKTEFIILGTTSGLSKTTTSTIRVGGNIIRSVKSARNIGGYFEEDMKKETHVSHTCKTAWYSLHQISKIRSYITEDQTKTLIHAYVTSKLDLNNSLLTE